MQTMPLGARMTGFEVPHVDLAEVIEILPDATAVFDAGGHFIIGNKKYFEINFDPDNIPEPGEAPVRVVQRIVQANRVVGIENMDPDHAVLALMIEAFSFVQNAEFRLTDGRMIQVSSTPYDATGFLMTFRDMGHEHFGEWRAAEMLSEGFKTADLGMIMWSVGQKVELANAVWNDLVLPTTSGDDVTDLFTALAADEALTLHTELDTAHLTESLAVAHSRALTFTLNRSDGRWIHISTFPTVTGRVIATAIDTSAERDPQARAHAMLTDAVRSLEIGVLTFDPDHRLRMINAEAMRMLFGGTDQPPLDHDLRGLLTNMFRAGALLGDSEEDAVTAFMSFVAACGSHYRPPWGGGKTLEFSATRTMTGDILVSVRDLTRVIALREALETERQTAAQNEKLSALGELLAGVAHELSNPLSVIVGYLSMVKEEIAAQSTLEKLDRIAEATERCVQIVKMFLSLAREKPAALQDCDVVGLVDAAIAVSERKVSASGGTIDLDMAVDLPHVFADPDHVTQVFRNLIANATHAIAAKGAEGRVEIRAYTQKDAVIIEVADNGPGIAEDIQDRIFEPFFTTKDVGQGIGFGLAFSHRVVTAHGGALILDKRRKTGARFFVHLPISPHPNGGDP